MGAYLNTYFNGAKRRAAFPTANWILYTGLWNDNKLWIDDALWID